MLTPTPVLQDPQQSVKFETLSAGKEERDDITTDNTDAGTNEERSLTSQPTDEDMQFLLSLYPHFQQVPMKKKLPLRIKIEKLLYETIYGDNDPLGFAHQI